MAELKTKKNDGDVVAYLNSVEHDKRREDSFVVLDLMKEVTGKEPNVDMDVLRELVAKSAEHVARSNSE